MTQSVEELFGCIATQFGIATGEAIQTSIQELLAMPNVDIAALQAAIAQIQSLLDADTGTEGFQLGQNIVTALTDLTTRVTALENDTVVASLQSMVTSLGADLATEINRAQAAEAALQDQVDSLNSQMAALQAQVATLPTSSCDCAALQAQITDLSFQISNLQAADAAFAAQVATLQSNISTLSGQISAASAAAAAAMAAATDAATAAAAAQAAAVVNAAAIAALDTREAADHAAHEGRIGSVEGFRDSVLAVDCSALRTLFANGITLGKAGGY